LVFLAAEDAQVALQLQPVRRYVVRGGRITAEYSLEQRTDGGFRHDRALP
jgi:hypothetical protein